MSTPQMPGSELIPVQTPGGSSAGMAVEPEFLELSLVLPSRQVFALAELAESRGLNVGQLLRRLIGNMLLDLGQHP
jgi:hypothetical protein